jgi:hypothetical protein
MNASARVAVRVGEAKAGPAIEVLMDDLARLVHNDVEAEFGEMHQCSYTAFSNESEQGRDSFVEFLAEAEFPPEQVAEFLRQYDGAARPVAVAHMVTLQ